MSQPAVAYCFDKGFLRITAVSTASAIRNSKARLRVYWCVPEEDQKATQDLLTSSGLGASADIDIVPVDVGLFSAWRTPHYISTAAYLRLLLPEALPEERIVYLDGDTLVTADIGELFDLELGGAPLGGVPDPGGQEQSKLPRAEGDPYINSGVLLMNLKLMREDGFFAKCLRIKDTYGDRVTFADQCIINKYAEGRKRLLPAKWNVQIRCNQLSRSESEGVVAGGQPRILHFYGSIKPWQEWCNPILASYWWSFAAGVGGLDLKATPIEDINQALILANALDNLQMYEDASKMKGRVIRALLNHKA